MDSDFMPRRGPNKSAPRPQTGQWQSRVNNHFQSQFTSSQRQVPPTNVEGSSQANTSSSPQVPKKSLKERLKNLSKKQWILICTLGILLLGGIGFAVYQIWIKSDPKPVQRSVQKKPAPAPPKPAEPILSTLTGLPIAEASINSRPVTAVMIENSLDARPQAGINQAGVVFEAVAEGGITRFLTLFQDTEPDYIGPVRSVRPYYVQWLAGFDAAVAHVGGSAEALQMLRQGEAKDLDQFANPGPYRRVSNRVAPHNMYSSVAALRDLQNKKGFTSTYKGWPRKSEAKSAAPNATSIDFNISGATYNPHYDYDPATNSYQRSEGGKAHTDEKTGQKLNPKVVMALVMPQGRNGVYTTYNTIGSGQAFVFQDGIMTAGTWAKTTNKENFTFTDSNGVALKLNPGQTWISIVGSPDRVSFK